MKSLPEKLLVSLEGLPGFDREAFVEVHREQTQITSVRLNPAKTGNTSLLYELGGQVPWSANGYYLDQRPSFTFDPLFHAGLYYVQEASSMFLEQAFKQLAGTQSRLKVLDLCAAPGGKSTHLQSLLPQEGLLVSNEVIRSRANILVDNIIKWGSANVIVTNNDPASFARLGEYFDVMVVDAPCSGSGLFRRDEDAIDEWSLNNVQLCCQRQQRILADVLPALKKDGILIYSTCSYSRAEDEDIMDWLIRDMEMENLVLQIDPSWNIITTKTVETGATGYRFYPDKLKGEGFFLSCFKKKTDNGSGKIRPAKLEEPTSKEKSVISSWVEGSQFMALKSQEKIFLLPPALAPDYAVLRSLLNIQYAGVGLGQVMKDRLVPDHSFAVSTVTPEWIPRNELDYDTAIKYLQRQDARFDAAGQGWQLVRYNGQNLGWVNVLTNRINNYYPRELRILKQENDRLFEK